MKFNSEQSGRSMVEMLGVLAIIGVLSVAGIAGYSKAMAKFKQSKLMDQVSLTAANVRTAYSGQPNYDGLGNTVARNLGLVEKSMEGTASNAIVNSYGGSVTFGTASSNTQFTMAFAGIPQDACVAIASADWGYGAGGLVKLTIGSNELSEGSNSLTSVATYCNGGNKTLTWYYN